ncbi:hypothetical protein VTI74DRAFT_4343 [Chaetomium olivicolor]
MVGVPGKYKGCETCRLRRVKCDNQRPYCKKCLDGGRQCAGYERETVFIVGTIENGGRCSSHPPRVVSKGKGKTGGGTSTGAERARSGSGKEKEKEKGSGSGSESKRANKGGEKAATRKEGQAGFELVAKKPLRPAWDDLVEIGCKGRKERWRLQVAGLFTYLGRVAREGAEDEGGGVLFVSFPAYEPPNVHPEMGEEEFWLGAQCLVHLGMPDEEQGLEQTESICLFLYEHNNSAFFNNQPCWRDTSVQHNAVRSMGPEYFRSFPNHHFFVRVYRHNAVMTALLNHTPTFLSEPQWITTPFEHHPKSPLDRLVDVLVQVPDLLARADRILAQDHTLARRLMAQDLLNNCLDVEGSFAAWYSSLERSGSQRQPLFWLADASTTTTATSTPEIYPSLSFRDTHTALCLTTYWTALLTFYPTLWHLYFAAVLDPVVDVPSTTAATTPYFPQHHPHQQQPATVDVETGMGMGMGVGAVGTGMGMGIIDAGMQDTLPDLLPLPLPVPPRLQILDPYRYALPKRLELAGNVCRGMDFLAGAQQGMAQPDLLCHALFVVQRFYGEVVASGGGGDVGSGGGGVDDTGLQLGGYGYYGFGDGGDGGQGMGWGMGAGDGRMELMWCEGFRERLVARGREIQEVVEGRGWVDLASF